MSRINPSVQRFSSRLMGIYRGEDWVKMCSTAPAEINHIFFASPTYCEHKVRLTVVFGCRGYLLTSWHSQGIFGMFGIWEVEDPSCD
jgi:hypothetical protein